MSKKNVEDLLVAGGEKEAIRLKYDLFKTMDEFVEVAAADGYEFTTEELACIFHE